MTMTIDEALAQPQTVPAWDIESLGDDNTLSVFAVAGAPRQLAYATYDRAGKAEIQAALAARGLAVGAYDLGSGTVWRAAPERFDVWGSQGQALAATREQLTLGDG